MKTNERIFHAILFEALALMLIVPITSLVTGTESGDLVIVGVGLSVFTVAWNYVYNLGFDRYISAKREGRSLAMRIGHTAGFEGGLIFITVPTIAWFLQISIVNALMLEAGFLIFFFFYATAFNWCYDKYQPYKKWVRHSELG
ncbi:PACE efflux transporter [Vibrio sp. NTOU-M3]|uniref:PACE efflux transporter n=1 Tax=Vibrio sp. NTOU-M3 TaxID=3234954 RepID=UPI00349F0EFE